MRSFHSLVNGLLDGTNRASEVAEISAEVVVVRHATTRVEGEVRRAVVARVRDGRPVDAI